MLHILLMRLNYFISEIFMSNIIPTYYNIFIIYFFRKTLDKNIFLNKIKHKKVNFINLIMNLNYYF